MDKCSASRFNNPKIKCPYKKEINSIYCEYHKNYSEKSCDKQISIEHPKLCISKNLPKSDPLENAIETYQKVFSIKMTIFKNYFYPHKISKLRKFVGPVFDNLLISDDNSDAISMVVFWEIVDGKKKQIHPTTYDLFSYHDVNKKIRCFAIQTICDMIKNGVPLIHPMTCEDFPPEAKERANKFAKIYSEIVYVSDIGLSENQIIDSKIINIFSELNTIGISLDSQIFKNIINNPNEFCEQFKKLVKNNLDINFLFSDMENKITILDNIQSFVNSGKTLNKNALYCFILLGALHSVSKEVRDLYPDIVIQNMY